MKILYALLIAVAPLLLNSRALADEASAWAALESAVEDADSAAAALEGTDADQLGAVEDTFDLAIQYLEGIVNGGLEQDANVESLIDPAFSDMGAAFQTDTSAANSFDTAFSLLESAAGALQQQNFQAAEDDADSAAIELFDTQDLVDLYGMDLMQLEVDNADLANAIQEWASGGGMGCP